MELVLEDAKVEPTAGISQQFPLDLEIACSQGHLDAYDEILEDTLGNTTRAILRRLAPSTELRFRPPGLAKPKEHKVAYSTILGRAIARGFLYEHYDLTWFARIEDIVREPYDGFSAIRKGRGNMPDWLAAGAQGAVVVEAKGVHRRIQRSTKSLNAWRKQLANVEIRKNGRARSLKGWIIATRWVTTEDADLPRLYAEDPRTPGEEEPSPEEMKHIQEWAAREHIAAYLARLGEADLSLQLRKRVDRTLTQRTIWKGTGYGAEGLDLIGRIRPLYWWEAEWSRWHEPWRFAPWFEEGLVFEGLDLETLKSALQQQVPDTRRLSERAVERNQGVLRDGTVIVPASAVRQDRQAEI